MSKRAKSQFHAWTFTVNNYTDEDEAAVKSLSDFASYIVCGKEVGEQGTPHLQGYCYMLKPTTRKAMSRVLKRAALFVSRGSDFDNFGYAQKESLWYKYGTAPGQGKRSDVEEVGQMTRMRDIAAATTSLPALKLAQARLEFVEPKRQWLPTVIWLYGPSGSGKTKSVFDAYGYDDVHKQDSFKWWQGYDGHEIVVIDDFRADFCKFHEFLTLVDRYPYVVEQKGGSRQLRARVMFITSCYSPWEVYKNKTTEDMKQLVRRLKYIVHVDADGVFHFNYNPYRKGIFI